MAKLTQSHLRSIIKEELDNTLNENLLKSAIMALIQLISPETATKLYMYGIIGFNKEDPSKAEALVAKMDKQLKIKVYMMALNTPTLPTADRNLITGLIMSVGAEQPQLPDASGGGVQSTDTIQELRRRGARR
jgi:hypothetical protein